MKFEALKRSIILYENEESSVYLAFCLIDSLLMDIKKESGSGLESNQLGDVQKLPMLIAHQCRMLKKIYENNADSFVQYKKNIEKQLSALDGIEEQLSYITDSISDAADTEKRYNELQVQLKAAEQKKLEYDSIISKIEKTKNDIIEFKAYDTEKAKAQLFTLENECGALECDTQKLRDELKNAEEKKTALCKEKKELEEKITLTGEECEAVKNGIQSTLDKNQSLVKDISGSKEKLKNLTDKKIQLENEAAGLSGSIRSLEEETKGLENEKAILDSSLSEINERYQTLLSQRNSHISEQGRLQICISDLTKQITVERSAAKSLADKKQKLDEEKNAFSDRFNEMTKEITTLTAEISELSGDLIPKQKAILDGYDRKKKKINAELADLESQIQLLITETGELEELKQEKLERVQQYNDTKAALTRSLNITDTEIKNLEAQLAELRGKSDREQFESLKQQLNNDITNLKNIKLDCDRMQNEIAAKRIEIQECQKNYTELSNRKDDLIKTELSYKQKLIKLEDAASDEFKTKLDEKSEKLRCLIKINYNLNCTLKTISEILGAEMLSEELSLSEKIATVLNELDMQLTKLKRELTECANNCSKKITWR